MSKERREIVIPSQFLGEESNDLKPGKGTFAENGNIYADTIGFVNQYKNIINIVPLKGPYEPHADDSVIGIVMEALSSIWLVDVNAAYPAFLNTNEVPWRVDFNETDKFLKTGDVVKAKILRIEDDKKIQITLKDRDLYKINCGHIINTEPSKVRRILGKKDSMISLIKKYTKCRIFDGKNGRIWVDGENEAIFKVEKIIRIIEEESINYGLTQKIEDLLKKDEKDVH